MRQKALEELKVIEYGSLISGPYCAKLLAGLGAEVIKVEKPGSGDEARNHGPFPNDTPHPERSGLFLALNDNKLGITLNLDIKLGKDAFKSLIENADVFIENNAPGHMGELGLGYDSLKKINPKLIMVSITPFGQAGPYRDYKAYHINCCAAGGEAVGIGHPDREPLTMPLSQGGYQAGVSAATAVLAALLAREKIGRGQYIDISEVEVWATNHVGANVLTFLYQGVTGIRRGIHGGYFRYPCTIFQCKDGYVSANAAQLDQWLRLLELLGSPKWAKNPRYRDRRAMGEQYPDEVDALMLPWFKEHTREEILKLCQDRRIPIAPVYNIGELVNHPHLKERNFFLEIDHSQAGRLKYPKGPCTFHRTDWKLKRAAPLLGEHNELILCQRLGYSKEDLVDMKKSGAI
jgi:crotonobetainyl-CoA:carnitine CoA-transferase CaiB-like acyl-CoA transferase